MELVAEASAFRAGMGEGFVREPRVQGAQPEPFHPALIAEADEVSQRGLVRQILAVLGELDASRPA